VGGAWGDFALFAAAFGFGIASALVPVVINAELYIVGLGALVGPQKLLVAVLSLVAGTVLGKAIVFELIRLGAPPWTRSVLGGGSTRWKLSRSVERPLPTHRVTRALRRWGDRLLALLSHRYLGSGTVLVSSLVSMPPLAVVTVLAAASRQPLWLFLLMVAIGRTAQFVALAFVVHSVAA
jgi:membrane protein YqaA with SNARE-associated domain